MAGRQPMPNRPMPACALSPTACRLPSGGMLTAATPSCSHPCPQVYMFIGRSLNASLSQLGTLTLCRALVQASRGGSCGQAAGWRWAAASACGGCGPLKAAPPGHPLHLRKPGLPTGPAPAPHHPTQALASPFSGILGDRYDRAYVVAAGCLCWGVMTSLMGLSTSLGQAMLSCAGGRGRGPHGAEAAVWGRSGGSWRMHEWLRGVVGLAQVQTCS